MSASGLAACSHGHPPVALHARSDGSPPLPLSPGDLIALPNPYRTDPVPAASLGPAIPKNKGYLVQHLGGNVYAVLDGSYQAMFIPTGSGVIVVDAPQTIGTRLLDAIHETTSEPITHVIYSHHHADHIGAADMFPPGVTRIAQAETAALLAADHDPHRPPPTVTFDRSYTLTVGTETLKLDYHGNVHSPGNIFIYAPKEKVLMLVDVVFPGWVPFARLAVSQQIPTWIAAHDTILTYDFTWYLGGHLTRIGTRDDVLLQRQYVHDLRAAAAAALQSVQLAPLVPHVDPQNPWALFTAYLGSVARQCAISQIAKYRGKLGAIDLHAYDHCWTMMESLRID
ncbi:MAG TPA: MBL fold metallo-hydrolase [Kofleriaceae bacterium]|nr:MBL fold metallo-hydrolase [Kofleriaceae bacterium]